jgi:hypothetical protein
MWLLVQRRIQCHTVLLRKKVLQDAICEICQAEDESPEHAISGCVLGKLFWEKINMSHVSQTTDLHTLTPPDGVPLKSFQRSLPCHVGSCGRQEIQGFSGMKHTQSRKYLEPARRQQNNGDTGFQTGRSTLLINGVRSLIWQDKPSTKKLCFFCNTHHPLGDVVSPL